MAKMQQVLAFGPVFLDAKYGSFGNLLRSYANLPHLLRSPSRYLLMNGWNSLLFNIYRRVRRAVGRENIQPWYDVYFNDGPLPDATVFFAAHSDFDQDQSQFLKGSSYVEFVPLPTANHIVARYLTSQGKLESTIRELIDRGRARSDT